MKAIRCAVWLWYRGDHFRGFQSQLEGGTVQQAIAGVLRSLGCRESVVPAGRTDRGVHARMQVVSIRLLPTVSIEEVAARLQGLSPGYLGVVAARRAEKSFHAGWSAVRKEYRYRISLGAQPPERWSRFVWCVRQHPRFSGAEPRARRLAEVLHRFEGARDFAAFHEKSSPRKLRRLQECSLRELGAGIFELRFVGDGFARYQVRYLTGGAALVAAGILDEQAFARALDEGAPFPGVRAPAEALVLWDVAYQPEVDPFSPEERARSRGIPDDPPFATA